MDLRRHINNPFNFTLVVVNFGINYTKIFNGLNFKNYLINNKMSQQTVEQNGTLSYN